MDVKQAIRALGGPRKVAQALNLPGKAPAATVAMWASREWVPYRWKSQFEALTATLCEEAT